MRRTFLFLFFFIALFLLIYAWIKNSTSQNFYGQILPGRTKMSEYVKKEIFVGPHKLLVEVADNSQKRQQGLSGRDFLAEDEGMLFVFEKPGLYTFWMKNMKIPLDFIWIRGEEIRDITENVPALADSRNLSTYQPREKVDKVLEVNAGWVARRNIKIGEKIKF